MPEDRDKKRPGSMSDADRAYATAKQRAVDRANATPDFIGEEDSMPILVEEYDEDPTPIETPAGMARRRRVTIQGFAEDTKLELRELRNRLNAMGLASFNMRAELVERLIKLETRFEAVVLLGGQIEDIHEIGRELGEFKTAMWGVDGKNGKLHAIGVQVGKARAEAASGPKFMRRMMVVALGSVLGSVIPAAFFVKDVVEKSSAERAVLHAEIASGKVARAVIQSQILLLFQLVHVPTGVTPP